MLRVAAWNRAAKVRPANHGCLVRCHVTWWIRSRSSKSLGDRGAEAAWLNIRIRRGGKAAGAATKQAAGVADILGVQVDRPGALRQARAQIDLIVRRIYRTRRSCDEGALAVADMAEGDPHRTGQIVGKRSEEHTSELQSLMRISYAVFCL